MPAIKEHTHRAYGFRREGRKSGRLLRCGTGHIDMERDLEEIAAEFEGVMVDGEVVRQILRLATGHLFLDRMPFMGGTGYFCLLPKGVKPQLPAEPQRPGEDNEEEEETDDD